MADKMYCVKCREKVNVSNSSLERDRRGRLRLKGKCPQCGTKTFKYVSEQQYR